MQFADEVVSAIIDLMQDPSSSLAHAVTDYDMDKYKVRLTEYSEVLILFHINLGDASQNL